MPEPKIILPAWIKRGMADLFPNVEGNDIQENLAFRLQEANKNKKPLRVKLGIDPTGTDIHLGHSILFRKLRSFQDAGHTAVLIIGDFTARIGDPTGKSKTRVQLPLEDIEKNASTYLDQLGHGKSNSQSLLDFETPGRLEVHRNSDWLSKIDLEKVIKLLSNSTVGQMLAKDDFSKRYRSGTPISLHEFLYPLLQAYDSVAVRSDIELGGTDQKFNVAMGRDLQLQFKQSQQFGLLLPILIGLDGVQKMSKSLGNTVGINEDPLSMYSKLEKIPDSLVEDYLISLTDLNLDELPSNPRELQKTMALSVTASFHGMAAAKLAQNDAAKLVGGSKESASDVLEVSISNVNFPVKAFYLLSSIGMCITSSEAKRQIKSGAFRLEGERITDPNFDFNDKKYLIGKVLQLGKKNFRRVKS